MHQPEIRTLCTHTFAPTLSAPARPCGSPALRGESFCFYHHPARERVPTRTEIRARRAQIKAARRSFTIPLPATRDELQGSLTHIARLIAADHIDLRRARQLLATIESAGRGLSPRSPSETGQIVQRHNFPARSASTPMPAGSKPQYTGDWPVSVVSGGK